MCSKIKRGLSVKGCKRRVIVSVIFTAIILSLIVITKQSLAEDVPSTQPQKDPASQCVLELQTAMAQIKADIITLRDADSVNEADAIKARVSDLRQQVVASAKLFQETTSIGQKANDAFVQGNNKVAVEYADAAIMSAEKLRAEGIGSCSEAGTQMLKLGLSFRALVAASKSQWNIEQIYRQRLLDLARDEQRSDWEAEALVNLAGPLIAMGDYKDALLILKKAEPLLVKADQALLRIQLIQQLASIYALAGQFVASRRYEQECLVFIDRLLDEQDKRSELERTYLHKKRIESLANLLNHQLWEHEDCSKAENNTKKIINKIKVSAAKLNDSRYEALALELDGLFYGVFSRNYDKALKLMEQGWRIRQDHERQPGQIFLAEEKGEALGLLSRAAAAAGKLDKSRAYAEQGLKCARAVNSQITKANVLTALGLTLFLAKEYRAAESVIQEALSTLTEIQSQFDVGSREHADMSLMFFDSFEVLQAIALKRGDIKGALHIAEKMRASPITKDIKFQTKGLQFDPVEVAQTWNVTIVVYGLLPDFRQWVLPGKLQGVQKGLEKSLLVWVINPNSPIDFQQVDVKTALLTDQSNPVEWSTPSPCFGNGVRLLDYIDASFTKEKLRGLHRLLIKPIVNLLPKNHDRTIVFVPYGPLHRVPFAALQDEGGQLFIQQHAIAISPSIGFLFGLGGPSEVERADRTSGSPPNALVMGIEYENSDVSLPNAPLEARIVASQLRVEPVLRKSATKELFLSGLPEAEIIHIASHGEWDQSKKRNSLIMANQEEVTPGNIEKLHLRADLVFLNACQTASGKVTAEGVFGLSRAFLNAGARSTIVSIWDVQDFGKGEKAAAPLFAINFYRTYTANESKAQAIRLAMMAVAKKYPDPRAWAGFTLIGAPD